PVPWPRAHVQVDAIVYLAPLTVIARQGRHVVLEKQGCGLANVVETVQDVTPTVRKPRVGWDVNAKYRVILDRPVEVVDRCEVHQPSRSEEHTSELQSHSDLV